MFVEAEASLRDLSAQTLREAGYRVITAEDPTEARTVAGILESPVDLLVTDVVVPDFEGLALADDLRAERPDLDVIFTSEAAGATAGPHRQFGGGDMLFKPFSPADLLARVKLTLGKDAE
ncbi:MAG: response regulator [Acidobacteriota bacterium]